MEKILQVIKEKLDSHRDISQWVVRGLQEREEQFFATGIEAEERRTVLSRNISVEIYHIEGKFQGHSSFTLSPHEIDLLDERIERALLFCRKLIHNRLFFMPSPRKYPPLRMVDRGLHRDASGAIESLWEPMRLLFACDRKHKLSTAEIFITSAEHYLRNSRGCAGRYESTRLFLDFVITASSGEEEAESHGEYVVRFRKDLPLESILQRHCTFAHDKLGASMAPSGSYPVIISFDALVPLFEPFIFHSSGKAVDMRISQFQQGKSVFKGECRAGDRLTITSDPRNTSGLNSFPYDRFGVSSQKVSLIRDGIFLNAWATSDYADYLGIQPTGELGNIIVESGSAGLEEMLRVQERLLHVVEFSFMHPEQTTGDFVDEIRLGYMKEKGKNVAVRGGSVSGNVFSAFTGALLSMERYHSGHYLGPRSAKFMDLSISGA